MLSPLKKTFGALAALLFLLGPASPAPAQEKGVTLKLGTLAPEGSTWDNILREMGAKWRKAGVHLVIYPGGVLGDEPDMVSKLLIGQIQVGVMTVVGLSQIDKGVQALSVPMLYRGNAESDYVRQRLQPILEKRLLAKGFKVLNWGEAGWVMFFGKKPILTPDDLKKAKFFVWGNDPDTLNLWQSAGFSPVPLSATDILPNLQTGLINAFDTTPLSALSFQWFTSAPNMTNLKWAPLVGATVITTRAWNSIPLSARPAVLKAAKEAGVQLRDQVRAANAKAVKVMEQHGLKVYDVTPAQYRQWENLFESVYPQIAGTVVPADIMKLAVQYRNEYREKHKASAGK